MADLSLRERLQPSLLDRLVDDERLLTLFDVTTSVQELQRLGIAEREFTHLLTAQGLRAPDPEHSGPVRRPPGPESDWLCWSRFAPVGHVSLAQLKSFVLKPPRAPQGVMLQSFCTIETRNVLNESVETAERRLLSMRRMREFVCRDLVALLNAISLDTSDDLTRYPEVQSSVLNFGMPSLAGTAAVAVDPLETATRIEQVISRFEPRLRKVRVTPEPARDRADGHALAFKIDAELWGQPVPQHLVLRTRIDTDSGNVSVAEAASG
jgi:type VI secretion system protein ImpF